MPFRFTVFTPTYNRAHTLGCVYDSLGAQTFRDFEWLIVDDGSTDGTEELVKRWMGTSSFTLRYFYQPNQGKHVAFNLGVKHADGELFLTLDSDDRCVSTALERFDYHWNGIPTEERASFSGITCLCQDINGHLVGSTFPADVMDSDPVTLGAQCKVTGEKWGFHRTDILRHFPFPVISGEHFVTEGLVWNRIAREYKIRFINEPLRVYEYLPDGLSASISLIRVNSPRGAMLYYREYLQFDLPWFLRLRAAINYMRFALHSNMSLRAGHARLGIGSLILWPVAYVAFRHDLRSRRKG